MDVSEEAAARVEATTRANIAEPMVLSLNGTVTLPTTMSAISGRELHLSARGRTIDDLCNSP